MNFKDEYKKENDKLTLDSEFVSKLSMKMERCTNIKKHMPRKPWIIVSTAMLFMVMCILSIGEINLYKDEKSYDTKSQGVIVPKLQILEQDQESSKCIVETLVYNNKVYIPSNSKLSDENAKKIMDNKIGVTRVMDNYLGNSIEGNATSSNEMTQVIDLNQVPDFTCHIAGKDVYTVKGYDDFRLITNYDYKGEEEIQLWECLNGFTMHSGKDVFGKMNIQGNVSKTQWDTYGNWDNETLNLKLVDDNKEVEEFISALYNAKPISLEENDLSNKLFHHDKNANENQKFIYLTMKDGVVVELRLFKEGYVYYSVLNGFVFKIPEINFKNLWNILK